MMKKLILLLVVPFSLVLTLTQRSVAQTDMISSLEDSSETTSELVIATFKSTRVINFQSVECVGRRTLDFRISHRFGDWSTGGDNLYGVDGPASLRLGLEYSPNGRIMFGLGRSSYEKMFDGFIKFRWLRQTTDNHMPISLTLVSTMFMTRMKDPQASSGFDKYKYFADRLSYCHQVIVARKFSPRFSAQLAPTLVHLNLAENFTDNNDSYYVTAAARFKVSNRVAITAEYGATLREHTQQQVYDSFGVGVDIETGGHVFQLFLTNSFGIDENQFLPYTTASWADRGFRLGFNISRVFTL